MGHKQTLFGKKYQIKLVGADSAIWVQQKDLSTGTVELYESGNALPKNAKAYVNRGHVVAQRELLANQSQPSPDAAVAKSSKSSSSPAHFDPIRAHKRMLGWCLTAQVYVVAINKILAADVTKRNLARKEILDPMEPPKSLQCNLELMHFLSGRLVKWQNKRNVLTPTVGKKNHITCTVCEKDFNFLRVERAITHVTSTAHHVKCKAKNGTVATENCRAIMQFHSESAKGTCYC